MGRNGNGVGRDVLESQPTYEEFCHEKHDATAISTFT